jgi:hypothetical protein
MISQVAGGKNGFTFRWSCSGDVDSTAAREFAAAPESLT